MPQFLSRQQIHKTEVGEYRCIGQIDSVSDNLFQCLKQMV